MRSACQFDYLAGLDTVLTGNYAIPRLKLLTKLLIGICFQLTGSFKVKYVFSYLSVTQKHA